MNRLTDTDLEEAAHGRGARSGLGFSAGVMIGFVGAIAGIALAVAAQRRRRRQRPAAAPSSSMGTAASADWQTEDTELDEELAQTFPASDPLPHSHRVD